MIASPTIYTNKILCAASEVRAFNAYENHCARLPKVDAFNHVTVITYVFEEGDRQNHVSIDLLNCLQSVRALRQEMHHPSNNLKTKKHSIHWGRPPVLAFHCCRCHTIPPMAQTSRSNPSARLQPPNPDPTVP